MTDKTTIPNIDELVKLIDRQFGDLSNTIGNILFLLESTKIRDKGQKYSQAMHKVTDVYSAQCDNILNHHKLLMIEELSNILALLPCILDKIKA